MKTPDFAPIYPHLVYKYYVACDIVYTDDRDVVVLYVCV